MDKKLSDDEILKCFGFSEDLIAEVTSNDVAVSPTSSSTPTSNLDCNEILPSGNENYLAICENYEVEEILDCDAASYPILHAQNNGTTSLSTNSNDLDTNTSNEYENIDIDDPEFVPDDESEVSEDENLNPNGTSPLEIESRPNSSAVDYGNMNEGRVRKIISDPQSWSKNKTKLLRMQGKPYVGYSRSREGVVKHDVQKCERRTGPLCISSVCQKSKLRKCSMITKIIQEKIFNKFWSNMNWDQRKVFISSQVTWQPTKRRTTGERISRRSGTLVYHLSIGHENVQVCRQLFMNTLAIGYKTIQSWVKDSEFNMHDSQSTTSKRRKVKGQDPAREFIESFLTSIPKLPSHYSRMRSSKLYLEPIIETKAQLYNMYKERCEQENKTIFSRKTFLEIFHSKNLAIYMPKKDKCDKCCQYECGNLDELNWNLHQKKRNEQGKRKIPTKRMVLRKSLLSFVLTCRLLKFVQN